MKTVKSFAALLLFSATLLFTSCTGDYDHISTTKEFIVQGTWAIDYFYAAQDKTAGYAIYQLTFYPNGVVICACKNDVFNGTWNMRKDRNRNDVLMLQLPSHQADLKELNLNWSVAERQPTEISMTESALPAQLRLRKL